MENEEWVDPLVIEGNRLIKVKDMYDDGIIRVPEGVEIICEKAGFHNHGMTIELPESLKRIESGAFAEMEHLEEPVHIPAATEYIADDAFSKDRWAPGIYFTVDERNRYYYAVDGVLYEKHPRQYDIYAAQEVLPLSDPDACGRVKEWGIVSFGTYPQTASGLDRTPIEWLVLRKDGSRALLLSRYALDCRLFDPKAYAGPYWSGSELRAWLNGEFFDTAFTPEEQDRILPAEQKTGTERTEKVSVLSDHEAKTLFRNGHTSLPNFATGCCKYEKEAFCRACLATPYAMARGAEADTGTEARNGQPCVKWWTSDNYEKHAQMLVYTVKPNGSIDVFMPDTKGVGVRPAIWVGLRSEEKAEQ